MLVLRPPHPPLARRGQCLVTPKIRPWMSWTVVFLTISGPLFPIGHCACQACCGPDAANSVARDNVPATGGSTKCCCSSGPNTAHSNTPHSNTPDSNTSPCKTESSPAIPADGCSAACRCATNQPCDCCDSGRGLPEAIREADGKLKESCPSCDLPTPWAGYITTTDEHRPRRAERITTCPTTTSPLRRHALLCVWLN